MPTEKLQQNDSLIGATEKQYKQLIKLSLAADTPKDYSGPINLEKQTIIQLQNFQVENCVTRGGCFWSDRLQRIIPGVLDSRNRIQVLTFPLFFERLKNSLSNESN